MGRRSRSYALVACRSFALALGLSMLTPTFAHAEDIWCRWFGAGCGGGGSASQLSAERDAPEIDTGTVANAIALAAGGAAILRGRSRRRR